MVRKITIRKAKALGRKRLKIVDKVSKGIVNVRPVKIGRR